MPWDDDAESEWDGVWYADEQHMSEWVEDGSLSNREFRRHVELIKADHIFMSARTVFKCPECEPVIFDFEEDSDQLCRCSLFGHFVFPWRCIPCVLAEEAKSVALEQRVKVSYEDFDGQGLTYRHVSVTRWG